MGITDKFGRVVNGAIQYAPKHLVINGQNVWTNSATIYHQNGWFTVRRTSMPVNEGYYYTEYWEEDEDGYEVVQCWQEHEAPVPADRISDDGRISDLEEAICEIYDVLLSLIE